MIGNFFKKIFGTKNDRIIATYKKEVEKINELEKDLILLSDLELQNKSRSLKDAIKTNAKTLNDVIYEAFALVREAAKRIKGTRHFDVQMLAGLGLFKGNIIEMKTGEGKTLSSTLPVYLNALQGPSHVITVNEYLAKRDSESMGEIYEFLGMSVGYIYNGMSDNARKEIYKKDIIYGTSSEFGFDFLRDNMRHAKETIQSELNFAIIDEADSVLIDEARTPLIISGAMKYNQDLYAIINDLVLNFSVECYEIDTKVKNIFLTESGAIKAEEYLSNKNILKSSNNETSSNNKDQNLNQEEEIEKIENFNIYDSSNIHILHLINQALKAHFLFKRDVDYVVQNNSVMIIDQLTGRIMQGRRYSDGLHQAIEQKENVPIKEESRSLASITIQNYFKMYKKLSGMTGTAITEAAELKDIYNLDVIVIPTNKPVKRIDYDDEIYGTKAEKYNAILSLIKERHAKGQPILIGTTSIEKSEELSRLLSNENIKHNVLNAKQHEQEAHIIAQAGKLNAVTIATNMAGRGTDIILGGVDGSNFEVNLKEETQMQNISEKDLVQKAGGLLVIGTERHESRRIDNQLRGRSARQGDPGESKFFLSLEDDLMQMFTSASTADFLKKLGLVNGEMIKHPIITRGISKTQEKIEVQNYEFRKNLIKFDDILNQQRKIIYKYRNNILAKDESIVDSILEIINLFIKDTIEICIPNDALKEDWNIEKLSFILNNVFSFNLDKELIKQKDLHPNEIEKLIEDLVLEFLFNKIFNQANLITNKIAFNLTKTLSELNNLDTKSNYDINNIKEIDALILNKKIIITFIKQMLRHNEEVLEIIKYLFLQSIDSSWQDHINTLEIIRQNTSLRAYGQKDPFIEYKTDSFNLFEKMLKNIDKNFLKHLNKINCNNLIVELLHKYSDGINSDVVSSIEVDIDNNLNQVHNLNQIDNNIESNKTANLEITEYKTKNIADNILNITNFTNFETLTTANNLNISGINVTVANNLNISDINKNAANNLNISDINTTTANNLNISGANVNIENLHNNNNNMERSDLNNIATTLEAKNHTPTLDTSKKHTNVNNIKNSNANLTVNATNNQDIKNVANNQDTNLILIQNVRIISKIRPKIISDFLWFAYKYITPEIKFEKKKQKRINHTEYDQAYIAPNDAANDQINIDRKNANNINHNVDSSDQVSTINHITTSANQKNTINQVEKQDNNLQKQNNATNNDMRLINMNFYKTENKQEKTSDQIQKIDNNSTSNINLNNKNIELINFNNININTLEIDKLKQNFDAQASKINALEGEIKKLIEFINLQQMQLNNNIENLSKDKEKKLNKTDKIKNFDVPLEDKVNSSKDDMEYSSVDNYLDPAKQINKNHLKTIQIKTTKINDISKIKKVENNADINSVNQANISSDIISNNKQVKLDAKEEVKQNKFDAKEDPKINIKKVSQIKNNSKNLKNKIIDDNNVLQDDSIKDKVTNQEAIKSKKTSNLKEKNNVINDKIELQKTILSKKIKDSSNKLKESSNNIINHDKLDNSTDFNIEDKIKIEYKPIIETISKNSLCPCGSNKKYKHCHGAQ